MGSVAELILFVQEILPLGLLPVSSMKINANREDEPGHEHKAQIHCKALLPSRSFNDGENCDRVKREDGPAKGELQL
jgi:hypothetical protein